MPLPTPPHSAPPASVSPPTPLPGGDTCPPGPAAALHWDLFCRVIDNHGDLGVCWRLAADLAERGHSVRLWVDDASALAWMAPAGHTGVTVHHWPQPWHDDPAQTPGDVVIEAFGCELPDAFVARMARRSRAPVWLNLEYLSAEDYVERSHGLPSPQWNGPGRGLTKWFFYPGWTPGTGGLLRERGLTERLARLDPREVLGPLGIERRRIPPVPPLDLASAASAAPLPPQAAGDEEVLVLLFGYAQPALRAWLDSLAGQTMTLLVTPGHSTRATAEALALTAPPQPGEQRQHGRLRLHFLPHVDQPGFDRLLSACDWNLVRGEDSAVRAFWAGRPFLWQLYVQDDGAHLAKLEAFLRLYLHGAPAGLAEPLRQAFRAWNGAGSVDWRSLWGHHREAWAAWAVERMRSTAGQPSLVDRLLAFVAARLPASA